MNFHSQAYQSKRKPPLVPKPMMRRKRSLKRQPSQSGSGRTPQPSILEGKILDNNLRFDICFENCGGFMSPNSRK